MLTAVNYFTETITGMIMKTKFGLIVTTRGFFNPVLASTGRRELITKLESLGYEYVILSETDTETGGTVETYEDAKKCGSLFREHKDEIKGIIVTAPNFGDEIGTVSAINLAELDVPVLIHACDDDITNMELANRRDAFCGKLSICANLYQYGISFTNTSQHTSEIGSEVFTNDLGYFSKVCDVVCGLRGARIAQFGTRPAAFNTVRYSEKLLQKSGITVIPVDMATVISICGEFESGQVNEKIDEIKAYGRIAEGTTDESIERSARLSLTVEKFMDDNECAAGTFQCWDAIQNTYRCAACLPMSMSGEKGRPMSCETDVTGAVSMLALSLASKSPSGYLDWNNSFGDDRDKCVLIHCSNYPKSFFGTEFEIGSLDILGASLGYENCFGACKACVAPSSEMSFLKISTDEFKGTVKAYTGEGIFTDDKVETIGSPAVAQIENLQSLLDYMCKNGFEHHVAMNRANVADVITEAFEKYLGWDIYRHK